MQIKLKKINNNTFPAKSSKTLLSIEKKFSKKSDQIIFV